MRGRGFLLLLVIATAIGLTIWSRTSRSPRAPLASVEAPDRLEVLELKQKSGNASAAELVQLGELYLERGVPLKAAEMAFRARSLDRDSAAAHNLLGIVYVGAKQPEKARGFLQDAVRFSPESVVFRSNLAQLELDQKQPRAAMVQLEAAARLDPRNAQVWLLIAQARMVQGHRITARDALRQAVAADPQLAVAHARLGILEMEFDHYLQATAHLEDAYRLGERSPFTVGCLALALLAGTSDATLVERAERLLAEAGDPEIQPVLFARGLLHQRRKEFSLAQASFNKVLRANPRNERALFALAECYRALGDRSNLAATSKRHHQLVRERKRLEQQERQNSE